MGVTIITPYRCPHCQGDGDTCTHCNGTGDRLLASLDRIATALEVIGLHLTGQREREHAALLSQLDHLERENTRAGDRFLAADARIARHADQPFADARERQQARDWLAQTEERMFAAGDALEAFRSAHREIAAEYDATFPELRS